MDNLRRKCREQTQYLDQLLEQVTVSQIRRAEKAAPFVLLFVVVFLKSETKRKCFSVEREKWNVFLFQNEFLQKSNRKKSDKADYLALLRE